MEARVAAAIFIGGGFFFLPIHAQTCALSPPMLFLLRDRVRVAMAQPRLHQDRSQPISFSRLPARDEGLESECPADRDCDGIDDHMEERLLCTDPQKKTLFLRPRLRNKANASGKYWPDFLALFPDEPGRRPGFARVGPLAERDVEVLVIGAEGHSFQEFDRFGYDPAAHPDIPCRILELVAEGEETFGDGHTSFDGCGSGVWSWDTKGWTTGGDKSSYGTPHIYLVALENYMHEGAYSQIAVGSGPDRAIPGDGTGSSSCRKYRCGPHCTGASPFNLNDGEAESHPSVFRGRPDGTVEFNPIAFAPDGRITRVGTSPRRYTRDNVLRHTIVHELGHAVLNDDGHCSNERCIMHGKTLHWELSGFGGPPGSEEGPGGCAHGKIGARVRNKP